MGLAMLEIEAYRNGANTALGAKRQLSVCRVGCPVQIGYWALHRKRGECLATVRFGRSALWPADAESNVMTIASASNGSLHRWQAGPTTD